MIFLHLITILDTVYPYQESSFLNYESTFGNAPADPLHQNLTDFTGREILYLKPLYPSPTT
jgi:hypothetical protein